MTDRSKSDVVRNPLTALPSAAMVAALPDDAKKALEAVLRDISADARLRAEKSWRSHKGPMAAYWKAVAVYARHFAILTAKAVRA